MEKLEDEIVCGGWRCMCLGVLIHAIQQVETTSKLIRYSRSDGSGVDKTLLTNRATAMEWLGGGVGLVTFEDCCEAVGLRPERVRDTILRRAKDRKRIVDVTQVRATWS